MKLLLLTLALVPAADGVRTVRTGAVGTPMKKILILLEDLKSTLMKDSQDEQKAYDKYACWCEDTLANKAREITSTKDELEALGTKITQLKADIASHGATVKQLKKEVKSNMVSQEEATEIREKEKETFEEEKMELENCLGAVETALGVLKGAGEGKKELETIQQAQLLGATAGLKGLLNNRMVMHEMGAEDFQAMQQFVKRPEDYVGMGMLSAAQIATRKNNPFGDYAPKSTQIQGILKGMLDTFETQLKKAEKTEEAKQKGFKELMSTKKAELATLEETLARQEQDEADKDRKLANSEIGRTDSKEQLAATKTFFEETKKACKEKAKEVGQRTRMRTEEMQGFNQAIAILSRPPPDDNSTAPSFLQFRSTGARARVRTSRQEKAFRRLSEMAGRYGSSNLAHLALESHSAGHFNEVIGHLDKMAETLRAEEMQDIKEKDMCENKKLKNKHKLEDLATDIEKLDATKTRMETESEDKEKEIEDIEADINKTKDDMAEMSELAAEENDAALKDMADNERAVRLLEEAIAQLGKFYTRNGLKAPTLLQISDEPEEPSHTAPTMPFSGEYKGRQETGGILAILGMIKEDYKKEIEEQRTMKGAASTNFMSDKNAVKKNLDSYESSRILLKRELAEMMTKLADLAGKKTASESDLESEEEVEKELTKMCAWVDSAFDSRRTKRKAELKGLSEAKNFLLGMDQDEADLA